MSTMQFNINIPHKPHNYAVCGIFYFYYYMKNRGFKGESDGVSLRREL